MKKTEMEIKIDAWWGNLTNYQQDSLEDKFFKETGKHLHTFKSVVECYNSLTKEEMLTLSVLKSV